jgi:hypothetical protein
MTHVQIGTKCSMEFNKPSYLVISCILMTFYPLSVQSQNWFFLLMILMETVIVKLSGSVFALMNEWFKGNKLIYMFTRLHNICDQ